MMRPLLPTIPGRTRFRGAARPALVAGSPSRTGITLLETLLAIALAGIILYFISTGVHLTLRLLEREREEIEEAHLARVLLEQIAADLRAAVFAFPELGASVPGGSAASGSSPDGDPDQGQNPTGGQNGGGGPDAQSPPAGPSPAAGAPPGGQGGSDSGPPPGDPSASGGSADGENTGQEAPSSGAALGLVGTRNALQIDIHRPPRVDQYASMYGRGGSIDIPTGLRTVRYELRSASNGGTSENLKAGLYRWESDCQVARLAIARANWGLVESTIRNLAPEVTRMEFRYYDGFRWWLTWDSQLEQQLPVLVEITLHFDSGDTVDGALAEDSDHRYRLLVRMPTAPLPAQTDSAASSGSSEEAP